MGIGRVLIIILMLSGLTGLAGAATPEGKIASAPKGAILNLTAEQNEKIQTLRENRWNDLKPLRTILVTKFQELKALLSHNHQDQNHLLKAKQSEITDIQSKIREKMAAYRMELRHILTKEQQTQLMAYGLERGYFRNDFKKTDFYEK